MKVLRLLFFFILAVVITVAAISFMQATYQQVTRSITIKAPPEAIYDKLSRLENFNRFFIWANADSSAVHTSNGTDGTVGASTSWKGSDEISGKGKITIKELEPNKKVAHSVELSEPKKVDATSEFSIRASDPNVTEVVWTFRLSTPRPWNVFNLFYSLDKEKGKDFEDGLTALKVLVEGERR